MLPYNFLPVQKGFDIIDEIVSTLVNVKYSFQTATSVLLFINSQYYEGMTAINYQNCQNWKLSKNLGIW